MPSLSGDQRPPAAVAPRGPDAGPGAGGHGGDVPAGRDDRALAPARTLAVRRRRQIAVAVPFLALVVAGALTVNEGAGTIMGFPEGGFLGGFAFIALAVLVFTLTNWRCPECDRYLGRHVARRSCPHCGLTIDEE